MPSAMDRVFSAVGNAVSAVTGGNRTDPGAAANTTIPGQAANVQSDGSIKAIPAAATGDQSPLVEYKDLFVNDPAKPDVGVPNPMPSFTLDPNKIQATAAAMDFTKDISSEEVKAMYPHMEESAARKVLNKIGANSFVTNFTTGAQTMEAAMARQTKDFTEKTIPEVIRRQQAAQLSEDQPLKNDPATSAVFNLLEQQFANKYPQASPAQIAKHTQDYFSGMMGAAAKGQGKQMVDIPKPRAEATDWDDFIQDDFGPGALFGGSNFN
jgi:hypothetical protein